MYLLFNIETTSFDFTKSYNEFSYAYSAQPYHPLTQLLGGAGAGWVDVAVYFMNTQRYNMEI